LGYVFEAEKRNGEPLFTLTEELVCEYESLFLCAILYWLGKRHRDKLIAGANTVSAVDRIFEAKFVNPTNRQTTCLKVKRAWWSGEITIRTQAGEELARATRSRSSCLYVCGRRPSVRLDVT
jgi:hypothetical protein